MWTLIVLRRLSKIWVVCLDFTQEFNEKICRKCIKNVFLFFVRMDI